ncbi:MAG: hypothetical protein JXB05_13520 [Myxococcaceae bacterium]|nr:hypothetical protein [Myxococcaceae bacterium]
MTFKRMVMLGAVASALVFTGCQQRSQEQGGEAGQQPGTGETGTGTGGAGTTPSGTEPRDEDVRIPGGAETEEPGPMETEGTSPDGISPEDTGGAGEADDTGGTGGAGDVGGTSSEVDDNLGSEVESESESEER